MPVELSTPVRSAQRLRLRGRVQGLGVRPAVARLAQRLGLAGSVRNTLAGLEIEIEGAAEAIEAFGAELARALPAACIIDAHDSEPMSATGRTLFDIERDAADGPLATRVPPDTAVCRECLGESRDEDDRRDGYSLISCAVCGPRYSLIRSMPFERDETSLSGFGMCAACQAEYATPAVPRFHAQTTACAACGPNIWAVSASGCGIGSDNAAVDAAIAALRSGQIVALCGVGGYQLLCDATCQTAVVRLRERKSRPAKPLAVLVADLAAAERIGVVGEADRRALVDPANPIVLLRQRNAPEAAPAVHPGLATIGVMLPTTALHAQISRRFERPLVCTSGNRDGDPLVCDVRSAERELSGVADLWLHHNRPIERPIDDSVVRVIAGRQVTIRLARGLAPLPLALAGDRPLVALGGHQKAAIAWWNGEQSGLGPHIGDLETLGARERFLEQYRGIEQLYRFAPAAYAHDRHPDYFTTRWPADGRLPGIGVQHHHAHVAAGMLEHGWLEEPVLGVAFDGTGYGDDGTIWGGEFFLAEHPARMRRVAHLRPFILPGGEAAIREPWRVAVSVLQQAVGGQALREAGIVGVEPQRMKAVQSVMSRSQWNPMTTSAGRLFDAAACLILGVTLARFDGEPAMRLEDAADANDCGQYPLPLTAGTPRQLDWRPLFAALWDDFRRGESPPAMSMRFHRTLSAGIVNVIRVFGELPVVLGGGVFQNRLLTELVVSELEGTRRLGLPGRIPPGDGGLAAGQLAIALAAGRMPR